ncbi:hypothetical protein E0H92_01250 [Kribbella speibonae]|uniref:TrbL/VirB6 plasmid conjugal transfer protein n=2 Tax=Kribbella speibonae TaxID=1572660 RepID=A0A4R0J396_9ACTN|nr:hypothetical protein E0H92_01250 [Kribbella speibonae]
MEWYLMCSPMDMKCQVVEGVQSAASNWIGYVNQVSTDFFSTILNSLATFWVKPETPVSLATSIDDGHTWTDSKTVAFVQGQTLKLTLTILALAIVIAGLRMAWEQRAKPVQDLLKALLTFIVVTGAGTATVQLLIAWSDAFSLQVIQAAIGGEGFESTMKNLLTNPTEHGSGAGMTSVLMLILIGQVAAWASLIQIVLMLIRSAMLVLLGSTLPLAAAATNTEVGKAWFKKYCAWTLGFIAYKPAAALIYAAAIKLKDDKMLGTSTGLMQSLTALMMMLLAVLAMPALLRLAVPITAAVGGGSAGMGSTGPDTGSLASGAVNVGSSSGARGGSLSAASSGGGAGASGAGAGGAGASGAVTAGGKAAGGAGLGPAGVAAAAGKKAAGAFAGAAAHSAGEAGGGSSGASMPRSSGSRSGGGRANSRSAGGRTGPSPSPKVPAGSTTGGDTGPSGNW